MPSQPGRPSPRWPRIALAVALGCAALWHGLPHWTWALYLEPRLEAMPGAPRLEVPRVALGPDSAAGGTAIRHAGLRFELPGRASKGTPLPSCPPHEPICQLELANGRVVVHSIPPREDFWEMVWLRAPDRGDLSVLRGASFNWNTIDALRTRVATSRSTLDSWRFESAHARGVVARTQRDAIANYVVAAYARDGDGARMLGVSGLPRDELDALIATIRFDGFDRSDAPAAP
jgi:hypothetical protein